MLDFNLFGRGVSGGREEGVGCASRWVQGRCVAGKKICYEERVMVSGAMEMKNEERGDSSDGMGDGGSGRCFMSLGKEERKR